MDVAGLVYKKGKFSTIEDTQLEAALENYRVVCVLSTSHTSYAYFVS